MRDRKRSGWGRTALARQIVAVDESRTARIAQQRLDLVRAVAGDAALMRSQPTKSLSRGFGLDLVHRGEGRADARRLALAFDAPLHLHGDLPR